MAALLSGFGLKEPFLILLDNKIIDISALQNLTGLINLYLSINQINDISPLQNLTSLTELFLDSNKIIDISPLVANTGLATGDTVSLINNLLSYESLFIYIPDLQDRGVTVHYDEPPLTVTTTPASDITTNSATLNGILDSLGTYSSANVSFEWGLDTSYGNETPPQTMYATGPFSASISGLEPGTTYHYRAKAVANGIVVYGDDVHFSTWVPGDANGDDEVNDLDLPVEKYIILGEFPPNPGADANQDGEINALDLVEIKRIIEGLEYEVFN